MKGKFQNWHDLNWTQSYNNVLKIQNEIVMAYRNKDLKKLYQKQRQLITSASAAQIAVRAIYTSAQNGSVYNLKDSILDTPAKRMKAVKDIGNIVTKIKSYELKSSPNLLDLALQYLYTLALDPILEEQSDPGSFGFRKHRSLQDVIERIMSILITKYNSKWVLLANIENCFDNIDQNMLVKNLHFCNKNALLKSIKVSKCTNFNLHQTNVLLPLLLNNLSNGLETKIKEIVKLKEFKEIVTKTPKVSVVRYANLILITGNNFRLLDELVKPTLINFYREKGLNVDKIHFQIQNMNTGFEFLGYSFRLYPQNYKLNKYNIKRTDVLVVRIAAYKTTEMRRFVKNLLKVSKPLSAIIQQLNPILKDWGNCYRITHTSTTQLIKLYQYIWKSLLKWARKKHPKSSFKELAKRYFPFFEKKVPKGKSRWDWGINGEQIIFNLSKVKKWTPAKLKLYPNQNPYTFEGKIYHDNRKVKIVDTLLKMKVLNLWGYKCRICEQSLLNGEPIEFHHILPKKDGGTWKLDNIQPIHKICHQKITFKSND